MNTPLFKKKFSRTSGPPPTYCTKQQSLALTTLLSLSILTLPYNVFAADLNSQLNNNIVLNDGDNVIADQTYGPYLYGIASPDLGQASFDLANNVTITAIGNDPQVAGIYMDGTNGEVHANQLTIHAEGTGTGTNSAAGIWVNRDNSVHHSFNLGNDSYISVKANNNAYGINLGTDGKVEANRLTIDSQGARAYGITSSGNGNFTQYVDLGTGSKITTRGDSFSYGILLNPNSTIIANALTIDTQTSGNTGNTIGIEVNGNNTHIDLGSNSVIRVTGANALGLMIGGEFKADSLIVDVVSTDPTLAGNSTVGIAGSGTLTDSVDANIGADSHISVVHGSGIVASFMPGIGESAVINFLGSETQRNSITVSGNRYINAAVAGYARTELNLNNTDIHVDYEGNKFLESMGLHAFEHATVNANNVTVNSTSSLTAGAMVIHDGKLNITGNSSIIQANASDIAIINGKDDTPSAFPSSPFPGGIINASGKLTIYGSVFSHDGLTSLDMQSGSVWTGLGQNNTVGSGVLNVAMTDSQWNMIDSSSVDTLALNNGRVIFKDNGANSVLTVGDLSGNGTFILNTNLVGDGNGINNFGDKLVVTGTSTGAHQLTVLNQGSLATTGNEVLTVVETQDGVATFTSTGQTELGGYLYDVRQNGNNWEIYSAGEYVDPGNPNPGGGGSVITKPADAGANFLNIGYLMNYAETQTLLQRMGDLRQNNEHGNMWLRGFAGKFSSFSGGKLSRFDMDYSGFQLGADKRLSPDTPLFAGLFIGQTNGSPDYRTGDGSARSSHMGIYGSYMANNGFYVDTVVKYANIKNNFNVRDSQNNQVRGNGHSQSISASLEAGQKFSLSADNNGFYVEPQLQFSYGHQDSTRIKASNGLRVDLGSYESMLGRASTLLGYEINQGDNSVNLYLKTGVVREFDGDVSYRLNGSQEKHTFKGNGWNNGVGISAQFGKQHTFYLDVDTVNGNKFDQRQVNGGYRFSF